MRTLKTKDGQTVSVGMPVTCISWIYDFESEPECTRVIVAQTSVEEVDETLEDDIPIKLADGTLLWYDERLPIIFANPDKANKWVEVFQRRINYNLKTKKDGVPCIVERRR